MSKPFLTPSISIFSAVLWGLLTAPAFADHEPVNPSDLFRDPPKELLEKEAKQAQEKREAEEKRIEKFKRQNADEFVNLPKLSQDRSERLDALFEILRENRTKALADKAAREIQRVWSQSGSETIDLMFQWSREAMDRKEYAKALDYLDNIVVLEPEFAEAWNRRATVHFLNKDYTRSIADVQKTLALEPRHYGALSGLGMMLRELGQDAEALAMMEEALKYNPTLERLDNLVSELSKKVRGRES